MEPVLLLAFLASQAVALAAVAALAAIEGVLVAFVVERRGAAQPLVGKKKERKNILISIFFIIKSKSSYTDILMSN